MAHFKWLILLFCFTTSYAQNQDGDTGKRLSGAVNSDAEELLPLIHPDGNRLYFSRIFHENNYGGKYGGSDIWVSKINATGGFEEAVKLEKPINNNDNNFIVGFSADGKRMYLNNTYKNSNKYAVAVAELVEGNWSKPTPITLELPSYTGPIGMYMHPNEKILLISMNAEDSYGKEDLYVMTKDSSGLWSEPQNLGATINTSGFEISPFLSDDGKTLYFASEGHISADIFKAEKKFNVWNVWEKKKNLNISLDDNLFKAYYFHYQDKLYYAKSAGKYLDIYQANINNQLDSATVKIQKLVEEAKKLIK